MRERAPGRQVQRPASRRMAFGNPRLSACGLPFAVLQRSTSIHHRIGTSEVRLQAGRLATARLHTLYRRWCTLRRSTRLSPCSSSVVVFSRLNLVAGLDGLDRDRFPGCSNHVRSVHPLDPCRPAFGRKKRAKPGRRLNERGIIARAIHLTTPASMATTISYARTSARNLLRAVRLPTRSRCTMLTCGGRGHRLDGCGSHWPLRWRWDWPS